MWGEQNGIRYGATEIVSIPLPRYSGELSDFGVRLDEIANLLWENVSYFCYSFYIVGVGALLYLHQDEIVYYMRMLNVL